MKLTTAEIKSITFGALRVTETEEGLSFHRHTEKQIAFWYGRREDLGRNAEGTATLENRLSILCHYLVSSFVN